MASPSVKAATDEGAARLGLVRKWLWLAIMMIPLASAHGEGGFESPLLAPGESSSMTFDEPGRVSYECEIHPFMQGMIDVELGTAGAAQAIAIQDGQEWRFAPADITVTVGDTVTWTNQGEETHQIGGDLPSDSKDTPGFSLAATLVTLAALAIMRR